MDPQDQLLLDRLISDLQDMLAFPRDLGQDPPSPFHSQTLPAIPLSDYIRRVHKFVRCSKCVFVVSLVYIARLQLNRPDWTINASCAHRLVLTATVLAIKFCEDRYFKNSYYAQVGGIGLREMNELELELFLQLGGDLSVTEREYLQFEQKLAPLC